MPRPQPYWISEATAARVLANLQLSINKAVRLLDFIPESADWHPFKQLRYRHGLTKYEVQKHTGIAISTVGYIENQTRAPNMGTAYPLLDLARELEPEAGHCLESLFPREGKDD